MQVLVRVDASLTLGSGHLLRCLTLARQLHEQGARVTFACRDLPGAPLAIIPEHYQVLRLRSAADADGVIDGAADCAGLAARLGEQRFDWCVVDHYALDAVWHQAARRFARRIMVIDDLADRSLDCDVLLDQGFDDHSAARYAPWLQRPATLLFGPQYALLREEFLLARASAAPRTGQVQRVVVFFTGGDDNGELFKCLQALVLWRPGLQVDVVIGSGHPGEPQLAAYCQAQRWRLHIQIDYMARLLAEADLAIGAAGSASWERCAVGVPSLLVILADNQRSLAAGLHRAGAALNLGEAAKLTVEHYRHALEGLTPALLTAMSQAAWQLVDGLGAGRVSLAMLESLARPSAVAKGSH